jgi:hypothetical protein
MALWDDFKTALRATRDEALYAFANIPTTPACQSPATSGEETGPITGRAGTQPASASDGVDVEGLPVLNVSIEYEGALSSVTDLQVYTWLMDEDENWHQVEEDGSPTVLISSALALTKFKAGPSFENEGWKRIFHEITESDSDAAEYVKIKVFPFNA